MRYWSVQDAKARISESLDACLEDDPQVVTKRGVEAAALVPAADWRRLDERARPTLGELLLAESPRFNVLVPPAARTAATA